MSNPIIAAVVLILLLAVASTVFLWLWLRQRKHSLRLYEGQLEWKRISQRNHTSWRLAESKLPALRFEVKLWQKQFRHLLAFVWGEPVLDRTLQHVEDFIAELRQQVAGDEQKKAGIAAAYEALSARLNEMQGRLDSASAEAAKRAQELATTEGALADIQEECQRALLAEQRANKLVETLYSKEWALGYRAGGLGNFYVIKFEHNAPQLAIGASPDEAIEAALLADRRASEGLSS